MTYIDQLVSAVASNLEDDVLVGQLNEGRRIDYVLQERPIEMYCVISLISVFQL